MGLRSFHGEPGASSHHRALRSTRLPEFTSGSALHCPCPAQEETESGRGQVRRQAGTKPGCLASALALCRAGLSKLPAGQAPAFPSWSEGTRVTGVTGLPAAHCPPLCWLTRLTRCAWLWACLSQPEGRPQGWQSPSPADPGGEWVTHQAQASPPTAAEEPRGVTTLQRAPWLAAHRGGSVDGGSALLGGLLNPLHSIKGR